eukprot:11042406-Ditylum_brightwellii.AAC.1
MKYYMVTSYGVDEVPVENTTENSVYGIGKGVTDTPPNWTFVSNVCQKAYEKHAIDCTISNSQRQWRNV